MACCIRCKRHYRELEDEQGDADCPHCGLTVEERARWFDDCEDADDD